DRSVSKRGRWGPYRQASPRPAQHSRRAGTRSARRGDSGSRFSRTPRSPRKIVMELCVGWTTAGSVPSSPERARQQTEKALARVLENKLEPLRVPSLAFRAGTPVARVVVPIRVRQADRHLDLDHEALFPALELASLFEAHLADPHPHPV